MIERSASWIFRQVMLTTAAFHMSTFQSGWCSLYDIATIAFTLIKKRAIRIFFIGFEDDGKLAKSFTYNVLHIVIIPLWFYCPIYTS